MHIRAFGIRATIVLRNEFLSWKVLRDAKSMGTAVLNHANNIDKHLQFKLSTEENNLINYLDLSIYRNNSSVELGSIENPQVLTPPYTFHLTIHMNIG